MTKDSNGIVATVISNLGLERYLDSNDRTLIRTQVGDWHVVARMRKDGYNVGGEQSGHFLIADNSPTGDGTPCQRFKFCQRLNVKVGLQAKF